MSLNRWKHRSENYNEKNAKSGKEGTGNEEGRRLVWMTPKKFEDLNSM